MEDVNKNTQSASTQPEENGGTGGKMFTQDEVNKIVSDRLNRERTKAEPSEQDKRNGELSARENRLNCREYLLEKGYSSELLNIINTDDSDKFINDVEKLVKLFPNIKEDSPRFTSYTPTSGNSVQSDKIAEAFKRK